MLFAKYLFIGLFIEQICNDVGHGRSVYHGSEGGLRYAFRKVEGVLVLVIVVPVILYRFYDCVDEVKAEYLITD